VLVNIQKKSCVWVLEIQLSAGARTSAFSIYIGLTSTPIICYSPLSVVYHIKRLTASAWHAGPGALAKPLLNPNVYTRILHDALYKSSSVPCSWMAWLNNAKCSHFSTATKVALYRTRTSINQSFTQLQGTQGHLYHEKQPCQTAWTAIDWNHIRCSAFIQTRLHPWLRSMGYTASCAWWLYCRTNCCSRHVWLDTWCFVAAATTPSLIQRKKNVTQQNLPAMYCTSVVSE